MVRHTPSRSLRFGALFALCLLRCNTAAAQAIGNGLNAVEGQAISASTGTPYYTDTMWADSTYLRWMLANHGSSSPLPVATFPCTHQGCIVYAGTPQNPSGTGYYTETPLNLSATQGVPLLTGSSAPQWASFSLGSITGLTNSTGTTLATSTGSLTSGDFAKIASSGVDYTDSGIATSYLAVADSTVGDGGVWSSGTPGGYGYSSTATVTPTSGTMYAHQLNLKWTQVIGNATVRVVSAGTGATLYVCLYNGAGNSLLWSANATVNAANTTVSLTSSQYTAMPGIYMLAFEQTGTSAGLVGYNTTTGVFNIRNGKTTRDATATGTISGGVCPSSLGTLTATTSSTSDLMVLLEP